MEMTLRCPHCSGEYLHQTGASWYWRTEDAGTGTRIEIRQGDVEVYRNDPLSGNPSGRRQGLTVHLTCELCGSNVDLVLAQHKGHTLYDLSVAD